MRQLVLVLILSGCVSDTTTGSDSGVDSSAADGSGDTGIGSDTGNSDTGMQTDTGADTSCGNTMTDANNCGACGHVCDSGQCAGGECSYHTVFITSLDFTGALGMGGGLMGADKECQSFAASAKGLKGTYLAWLSIGATSPSTRFKKALNPYKLTDGTTTIATSWASLTTNMLVMTGINVTESKGGAGGSTYAWTNTKADGTTASGSADCMGFTMSPNNASASGGIRISTTAGWTDGSTVMCNQTAHLYCFEQ